LCHNLGYLILTPAGDDDTIVHGAVSDKPFMCRHVSAVVLGILRLCIMRIFVGMQGAVKMRYFIVILLCVFHEIIRDYLVCLIVIVFY
jgi:hypothetical protein